MQKIAVPNAHSRFSNMLIFPPNSLIPLQIPLFDSKDVEFLYIYGDEINRLLFHIVL
jgi:hypothetical protein